MLESIIIQHPPGAPAQLILLLHGASDGTDARALVPLGEKLAEEFSRAMVVSISGSDAAAGPRQWFSLHELAESGHPEPVATALAALGETIRHWQEQSGVGSAATALIGFAQGAILALESSIQEAPPAGRVVAIAGRFACLPERVSAEVTLHLIHGKGDAVIPYRHTIAAAERLLALGADLTADVLPMVGHEINQEVETTLLTRLKGYVPRRLWEAAMREVK